MITNTDFLLDSTRPWEKQSTQLFLLSCGGDPSRKGFLYLAWAIDIVSISKDVSLFNNVYEIISYHLPSAPDPKAIDLAIRREIQSLWVSCPDLFGIFGALDAPPSPKRFIGGLSIFLST